MALVLGIFTVTASAEDALCDAASATFAVKENDPVFDGVPLRIPAALSDIPAGSDPAVTLHA